jgi:hypothetical protein
MICFSKIIFPSWPRVAWIVYSIVYFSIFCYFFFNRKKKTIFLLVRSLSFFALFCIVIWKRKKDVSLGFCFLLTLNHFKRKIRKNILCFLLLLFSKGCIVILQQKEKNCIQRFEGLFIFFLKLFFIWRISVRFYLPVFL